MCVSADLGLAATKNKALLSCVSQGIGALHYGRAWAPHLLCSVLLIYHRSLPQISRQLQGISLHCCAKLLFSRVLPLLKLVKSIWLGTKFPLHHLLKHTENTAWQILLCLRHSGGRSELFTELKSCNEFSQTKHSGLGAEPVCLTGLPRRTDLRSSDRMLESWAFPARGFLLFVRGSWKQMCKWIVLGFETKLRSPSLIGL